MLMNLGKMALDAKKHLLVLTGIFSLCCLTPNGANAINFDDITAVYFFGDSLTDSGFNNGYNIPIFGPMGPKAATFTTIEGYVWSQWVARDIKPLSYPFPMPPYPTHSDFLTNNTTPLYLNPPPPYPVVAFPLFGVNYACGGARTDAEPGVDFTWAPSVAEQVQNYLTNFAPEVLDPKAVNFIWTGANDILYGLQTYTTPQQLPQFMELINQTTTQIVNLIEQMSNRGAKRFVVMSLPNIGVTPLILSQGSAAQQNVKNLCFIFNSLLNQKLGYFLKKNKNVKILYFDTYLALDNIIKNAEQGKPTVVDGQVFYFDNVTDPVCVFPPGVPPVAISCPQTSNNHLFADDVHPTGLAHEVLALEVERQMRLWK